MGVEFPCGNMVEFLFPAALNEPHYGLRFPAATEGDP